MGNAQESPDARLEQPFDAIVRDGNADVVLEAGTWI